MKAFAPHWRVMWCVAGKEAVDGNGRHVAFETEPFDLLKFKRGIERVVDVLVAQIYFIVVFQSTCLHFERVDATPVTEVGVRDVFAACHPNSTVPSIIDTNPRLC